MSTQAPDRYSGHPISSLSANLVNLQRKDLYSTIINRQRELKEREEYLQRFENNVPQMKSNKLEKAEKSINELKHAFSVHSKKLS